MGSRNRGRPEEPLFPASARQRFGVQLRHLRKSHELTQQHAAAYLSCSQTTISHAERGKTLPSEAVVREWDRALGADGVLVSLYEDVLADDRLRALAAAPALATPRKPTRRPNYPIAGDLSEWVCDVTVPDGTVMRPLQVFTKVWRVRNVGTVAWIGRYIMRQGSTGSLGQVSSPRLTPVCDTQPGRLVDVSVLCRAQMLEGSSIAYFKFADADGNLYFPTSHHPGIVLEIRVQR